jgi:3-phosphoshikimate 1-carboxyvinyltransferase
VKKFLSIKNKLEKFNKKNVILPGDKSISIRFLILSSLAKGKSVASNILKSEDVINTAKCLRKLGIKIKISQNKCEVFGKGLNGFEFKKNLILDAGNSGTCARLMIATIINTSQPIKIIGDHSLSTRDMKRVITPLKKFGAKFKKNNGRLPLTIIKSSNLKPIKYVETLGSAQCKSAVMLAALKTNGTTFLKCKPSRNHTEIMYKDVLNLPIKIKKKGNYDLINIKGNNEFKSFNYNVPSDISSASFFIVLTLLGNSSEIMLKNINTNKTRIGIISILNLMGAKIKFLNSRNINGERISDIYVKSNRKLKSINLNPKFNSSAIDEFLLIFLVASICKGNSTFNNLTELNKKESKRLDIGVSILQKMGIEVKKIKNNGIKIFGKPNLDLDREIIIKDFMKDHRVFMVSVIAGLTLGGEWKIYNPESINTSFPSFLKLIKNFGAKIN